ncbi:MAG: hypothetical protein KA371_01910 [Acidobacteria bacterium]|nr:hypothetical protein [Acidobacteriota bacterium]
MTESHPISLDEIRTLAAERFGGMIKGVVDPERGILLLDADLHADQEASLLADGSKQAELWGINLRPSFGNRSRGVDDPVAPEWPSPLSLLGWCVDDRLATS